MVCSVNLGWSFRKVSINVAKRVPELLEDASNELPVPFRHLIDRLTEHLKELDRQVKEFEKEIIDWHRSSELSRKLEKLSRASARWLRAHW